MSPAVKYTLGRIGLFLVVLAALLPVQLNIFVKLMIALVFSATLSFFLLRTWRDQMARQLAGAATRRRAEKERLRAALAGDEDAAAQGDRAGGSADDRVAGAADDRVAGSADDRTARPGNGGSRSDREG